MLDLQRQRNTNQSATARAGHDPADPEYVQRLSGPGGEVQLKGPLQELQWTESGTQEENSRSTHRQR